MDSRAADLQEFYHTPQGHVVQRLLRQSIRHLWPHTAGLRIVGLGYALPYLGLFLHEAQSVIALMPARQGASFWPSDHKGLVALCAEDELPLETHSVDRIVLIHGAYDNLTLDILLREAWRLLKGEGRLLMIVPNRTGLWARTDSTPFGFGTPWSMGQLRKLLQQHLFIPEHLERALFVPPLASPLLLRTAKAWENMGHRFFNALGGVNIVEASKQLYSALPLTVPTSLRVRRALQPTISLPLPDSFQGSECKKA